MTMLLNACYLCNADLQLPEGACCVVHTGRAPATRKGHMCGLLQSLAKAM